MQGARRVRFVLCAFAESSVDQPLHKACPALPLFVAEAYYRNKNIPYHLRQTDLDAQRDPVPSERGDPTVGKGWTFPDSTPWIVSPSKSSPGCAPNSRHADIGVRSVVHVNRSRTPQPGHIRPPSIANRPPTELGRRSPAAPEGRGGYSPLLSSLLAWSSSHRVTSRDATAAGWLMMGEFKG